MKKQFCSYEICLKLKELGFNEECFGYYRKEEDLMIYLGTYNSNMNKPDMHGKYCAAPLWQQAIDWFREKYNLWIDSPTQDFWNKGLISVKLESIDKSIILEHHVDQPYWRVYRCFKSYEEAREQSILKAIESCQNIQK